MWEAMRAGYTEIVEIFIGLGADPDQKCTSKNGKYKKYTFLQYVTRSKYTESNFKVAKVLVRHGAKMDTSTNDLSNPLQMALTHGNLKFAEFFLANGASLVGPQWNLSSPAEYTFYFTSDEVCKESLLLLAKYGCDFSYRSADGENLLHLFLTEIDVREDKNQSNPVLVAETLLDLGVPINQADNDGRTPLHHAISPLRQVRYKSDIELAKLFVKRGADVNFIYKSLDKYPLALAVVESEVELVDLLASNGAELEAKDENGYTALHFACAHYNKPIIELLIRKGADIRAKDRCGRTPFNLMNMAAVKRYKDHGYCMD